MHLFIWNRDIFTFFVVRQNKCVRYWPDEDQSKELKDQNTKIVVKHVSEKSTADYTLREFQVINENEVRFPSYCEWVNFLNAV